MPFTPSHAVVALPFLRTPLVPAAIAVGAMTPDLPLFARGFSPLGYARTHDPTWLPATVVLALALLLVWRCVLRPAARELAPAWIAFRLPPSWDAGPRVALGETFGVSPRHRGSAVRVDGGTVALLALSLAIGVASHIAWDAFTHEGRVGSDLLPALAAAWGPVPGYRWLQYASGAAGLVILGVSALRWLRRRTPVDEPRVLPTSVRVAWGISLPAALAIAWGAGLAVWGPFDAAFTPAHLGYRVLPPACGLWGLATVALCVVVTIRRGSRRR